MTHMMLLSALPTPSRSCNELSILCDFCIVDLDDQLGGMVWAAWALYSAPQEISSSPSGPLWYPWVLCSLWYSWPLCSHHIRPHDTLLFATGVPLENVHGSFTHRFSFMDTPPQTFIYMNRTHCPRSEIKRSATTWQERKFERFPYLDHYFFAISEGIC